ncbi:MAG: hypothetical protein NTY00_00095 [Deltaproteobacteria bacterium]|nr:hypothetical protein [Deltaproteobacteria bacterium]
MKIVSCFKYALVGMLLCGNVLAAERKGLQAVGLSKLSDTSTINCAAAIRESGCREFEFAFMPFFNPTDPFKNVGTLLDIPNVSKVETIFLSWREEAVMKDTWPNVLNKLNLRAREVNTHVNEVRDRVTKIILVPMLEDRWTEAMWLEAVHTIAGQIDSGAKIYFRRSEMMGTNMPPSSITTRLKNGTSYTFTSTRLEAHRIDHGGSAQVISNDGGLVYQDSKIFSKYETKSSLIDAPGGYCSMASWISAANSTSKVSILWRPSYNLFTRTYSGSEIKYQKPSMSLDKRSDSDSDPAFNSFEKEVLKSFLR